MTRRKKNPSRDLDKGIEKYEEFHQLPHKSIGTFQGLKIPRSIIVAGEMRWVAYSSKKWTGKKENYIHDHEGGVQCGRTDADAEGERVEVPKWLRETKTLALLGECMGFGYEDPDGDEVEAAVGRPRPELYCTPDGKALLVIEKKRHLVALIWGGFLDVEARGIVN